MSADPIHVEPVVTRKPQPELPPPFVCAICEREIHADPWQVRRGRYDRHQPPICFSCSNIEGHQVRIPHMTRGDHHALQRLSSITNALLRTAHWKGRR